MSLTIWKKRINKSEKKITIPVSGSKNSAVAIIPAALLSSEEVKLTNIPNIEDVRTILKIISDLGHYVYFNDNILKIKRNNNANWILSDDVNKLRGSYYFIGVYLAYFGKIALKSSGGCDLGVRSTNYHLDGFKRLKAKYKFKNNYEYYKAKKIKGSNISLPSPSVGATINIILASVFCKGETVIANYAKEVEVIDVCNFLNSMGANITFPNNTIRIKGVKKLHSTTYRIIPDRIEAGTYLALGCLNPNVTLTVSNVCPDHLESFLKVLHDIGHIVTVNSNSVTVKKGENLHAINIDTSPYPGFPTDLNPIITVLLTQIPSTSTITENIFSNRFSHVKELNKMGANISIDNKTIIIKGKSQLFGTNVYGHDLRCSAALMIASTIATNKTTIENIETLERGYENYLNKLQLINIKCIKI